MPGKKGVIFDFPDHGSCSVAILVSPTEKKHRTRHFIKVLIQKDTHRTQTHT